MNTFMIINVKKIWTLLIVIGLFGCHKSRPALKTTSSNRPGWKTIAMGKYLIDVPNEFNLKLERGIDSQPGLLKGKGFYLAFDYGPYCDTLVMTTQEFIRKGWWKDEAIIRFLNHKQHPNADFRTAEVVNIRPSVKQDSSFAPGCDFIASCNQGNDKFKLPVFIPQEIKDHIVIIDTIQHYYRRMVHPRKGVKGTIGVYMRKENVSPDTLYNGIVIAGEKLNNKQQAIAMEIVASLRPRPKI